MDIDSRKSEIARLKQEALIVLAAVCAPIAIVILALVMALQHG